MRFQDSNRVDRECDRIGLRIMQREAVVATSATERRLAAIMVADVAGFSRERDRALRVKLRLPSLKPVCCGFSCQI